MMRSILGAAISAAALLVVTPAFAAPPPAEVFGALPLVQSGHLSPDGKHLALVQPVNGRQAIVIYDLSVPDAKPHVVSMEGGIARNAFWKNNDRLICIFVANLKQKYRRDIYAWSRAISVDANGQNAALMFQDSSFLQYNTAGARVVDLAPNEPNHIYMEAYETNAERNGHGRLADDRPFLDLFRVNILLGYSELVAHGDDRNVQFLTDGQGNVAGTLEQDTDLTRHLMMGGKEVATFNARGGAPMEFDGLTANSPGDIVFEHDDQAGRLALYVWKGSATGFPLYENKDYDVSDTVEDDQTGRIVGARYEDDRPHTVFFDPKMEARQQALEKAFPDQSVDILSHDATGDLYVIRTDGPRNPPVLSLYNTTTHQVNIIQEAYPALKPADLGEMKPYLYKARDGLDIHAYLTLPPGKDARNLPTVIFPHGGPEDRDGLGFDWWAQFMASRGYAVLQPNYRGSSGYGQDFVRAGDGEWAGKAQDDLEDGVKKLVADGIADPKRVCIVGASWGGYLALGGASFKPDLYACAVSYAGPSDMNLDLYTGTVLYEGVGTSIWKRRMGALDDSKKLDAQSPINFVKDVKIPILLLHSEKDTTVKIEQSEMEKRALEHAGKQVEFVKLDGDDHYLEYADSRIKLLKEIDRFLAAHIGPSAGQQTN